MDVSISDVIPAGFLDFSVLDILFSSFVYQSDTSIVSKMDWWIDCGLKSFNIKSLPWSELKSKSFSDDSKLYSACQFHQWAISALHSPGHSVPRSVPLSFPVSRGRKSSSPWVPEDLLCFSLTLWQRVVRHMPSWRHWLIEITILTPEYSLVCCRWAVSELGIFVSGFKTCSVRRKYVPWLTTSVRRRVYGDWRRTADEVSTVSGLCRAMLSRFESPA